MEDPLDGFVESGVRIVEAVDVTLHTDESEERDLEKVHRDVELEHV